MMHRFLISILTLTLAINLFAQNKNISNGNVFEGEPFIAVNPTNPQQIVVAWMGFVVGNGLRLSIKVRSSFNGGATWTPTVIMPHVVSTYKSADPSMVFDHAGNLFLCYIDYQENPDAGAVYLFSSSDGGLTWGNPVPMLDAFDDGDKRPIDRPWLTINEAGDKLYLTTKPAPWVPAPNRPYFVKSSDSGLTWSPWRYLDDSGYLVGNLIQAPMAAPAATGDHFFAVYPSYLPSQSILPQYVLAASSDGGNTFQYRNVLSGTGSASNDSAKLAYKLLVDPSDNEHLVFIYPYQPFGDFDIMMTETFNSGNNWTSPWRVNDDSPGNGKMQDMIWGDFDEAGALVIAWRDRRNAAGSGFATASEFFAAYRPKNASDFNANFKLSDISVAYNNVLSQSGNDFMGIELSQDTISAVWANTRDGSLDIWFVRAAAATGQVSGAQLLSSESDRLKIYPVPSTGIFNIAMTESGKIEGITVYDVQGKMIQSTFPEIAFETLDLRAYPSGMYTIHVFSMGQTYIRKVLR